MMRGIGVLIADAYARLLFKCRDKELNISPNAMWFRLKLLDNDKRCAYVCTVYMPFTDSKITEMTICKAFGVLTKQIGYLRYTYPGAIIILGGDFNSHTGKLLSDFGSSKPPDYA